MNTEERCPSYDLAGAKITPTTSADDLNNILRSSGRYGVIGAFLAEAIRSLLSISWVRRLIHTPVPLESWLKIAAATCAILLAAALIPGRSTLAGLITAVLAGVVSYGGAIALTHICGVRPYVGSFSLAPNRLTPP
jgi:hypothetical protein